LRGKFGLNFEQFLLEFLDRIVLLTVLLKGSFEILLQGIEVHSEFLHFEHFGLELVVLLNLFLEGRLDGFDF
jgi:hypothetical protein